MAGYEISYGFDALLVLTLLWGIVWSPTLALYERILVVEAGMLGFPTAASGSGFRQLYPRHRRLRRRRLLRGAALVLYAVLAGTAVMLLLGPCIPDPAPPPRRDHAAFGLRDLSRRVPSCCS